MCSVRKRLIVCYKESFKINLFEPKVNLKALVAEERIQKNPKLSAANPCVFIHTMDSQIIFCCTIE